ncbi:hypothetical protein I316_05235 [Kwoniella heveanensis BCC8398]|uniref:Zn(2)-C6 fungal-type domain-containing protein n=1 Tax=Kwoniella heveanensis BCC8398 TaxID=1296120 RepID=A0A1B9GQ44_9TREE|nr:hypothetical protein I316_05235 [Kwoniella heveanensis BCC8398]
MSYPYIGGSAPGPSTNHAGPSSQPYSLPPPPPPMHASSSSSSFPDEASASSGHGQQVIMGWNGYGPSSNGTWGHWGMSNNGGLQDRSYNQDSMVNSSRQPPLSYAVPPPPSHDQANGYGSQMYGQKSEQESGYTGQTGVSDYVPQNGVEGSPTHKKHFDTAFAAPAINLGTGDRFSQLLEAKMNMMSGNVNGTDSVMIEDPQSSSSSSAFDYRTYSSYTMPSSSSSTGPQMSVPASTYTTSCYLSTLPQSQTCIPPQTSVISTPPVTNLGRADLYNSGPPPPPDPLEAHVQQAQAQYQRQSQSQTLGVELHRYPEKIAFPSRAGTNIDAPNYPSGLVQSDWMPAPLQYSAVPPPPPQGSTASASPASLPLIPQASRLHQISPPTHQLPAPGHHIHTATPSAVDQPPSYEPSMVDRRLHDPSATHIQPDLVAPLPSEVSYHKSRKDYLYAQNGAPYTPEYGPGSTSALPSYSVVGPRSTFPHVGTEADMAYGSAQPLLPLRSPSTYAPQHSSSPSTYPSHPVTAEASTQRNKPSPGISSLSTPSASYASTGLPATAQSSSTRISPPSSSLIQPKSAQLPPLPTWQHAQSKSQPTVFPWNSSNVSTPAAQPVGGFKKHQPEILPPLLKVKVSEKGAASSGAAVETQSASDSRPSTPAKFSLSTSVRASMLKDKKKAKGKGTARNKDKPEEAPIDIDEDVKNPSARPEKKKRKTAVDAPTDVPGSTKGKPTVSASAVKEGEKEKASVVMSTSTSASSSSKKSLPEKTVIACNNCRSKKLKCNGERPKCYHCTRRGEDACTYEAILRRRGPGKHNKEKKPKDDSHSKKHLYDTAANDSGANDGSPSASGSGSRSGSGSGSSSEVEEPDAEDEQDGNSHQSQASSSAHGNSSSNNNNDRRSSVRPNIGMGGGDIGGDSHWLKEEDIKGMEYVLGASKGSDRHGSTGLGMGFGGLSMGSGSRFELSTARD